jgi:hypothetical protein
MKALVVCVLVTALLGCATVPLVNSGSPNFIEKGSLSDMLRGGSFFVAEGLVDVYQYDLFGYLEPAGRAVDSAVAIEADKDTGRAVRVVTMQPLGPGVWESTALGWRNSATLIADGRYAAGDLVGGISVTDIHPAATWLEALAALKKSIKELGTITGPQYVITAQPTYPVIVTPPAFYFDFGWHRWPYWHHGPSRRWPR